MAGTDVRTAFAPPPSPRTPRLSAPSILRGLIPAAILLTAVCAMTGNRVDTDLWGHVVYGREVLRDGALPRSTTWSYVTQNHPWINHENLAEIALAWTVDRWGPIGLSVGKLLLAVVIVGSLLTAARGSGAGWLATAVVAVAAAEAMEFHWHFRPQALTYAAFAVMIALLDAVFRSWEGSGRSWREMLRGEPLPVPPEAARRLGWLALLPPLFVVWTNAHGGFAAGLAVLWVLLGLRAVQGWTWWGRAAGGVILRLVLWAALATLATFLNPYGETLHAWLLYDVGADRPEISDWRPFDLLHDPDAFGVWWLLAIGSVALIGSRRRRDPVQLLLLGITLGQGLWHCRHLVFFAILCGCWLPRHLHDVLLRLRERLNSALTNAASGAPTSPRAGLVGLAAILAWIGFVAGELFPRLKEIPVRRDWYPVSAMQYVVDRGLSGRFLVEFNWAQYALMCFAEHPSLATSRVAVDGRLRTCYPWETLDVYLDFFLGNGGPERRNRSPHSPPFVAERALQIGPPDLLLLWRERRHSTEVVAQAADEWVLLYQDGLAQLWGRRARYDDPASPQYLPPSQRQIGDEPQCGSVPWPAIPRSQSPSEASVAVSRAAPSHGQAFSSRPPRSEVLGVSPGEDTAATDHGQGCRGGG